MGRRGFRTAVLSVLAALALTTAVPASASADTGGTISGIVTLDTGGPALGGSVSAYGQNWTWLGSVQVDASGGYALTGLPAGDVRLQFGSFTNAVGEWYADAPYYDQAQWVSVTDGGVTPIDATLAPAGSLEGHVSAADGSPALGGNVTIYGESQQYLTNTWVNESGDFFASGLPVGNVKVRFDSFSNGSSGWYDGAPDFASAAAVSIAAGATTAISATLLGSGTIAGTVSLDGGGPATGGQVTAYVGEWNSVGSAWVGADGTYVLAGVPAGDVRLQFSDFSNAVGEWFENADSYSTAAPVTVAVGATTAVNASLSSAGAISGTVTVTSGEAATGGYVYAYGPNQTWLGMSWVDSSGTFAIGGLPSGEVRLQFQNFSNAVTSWYDGASDYSSAQPVLVSGGATTTINPVLASAGSITGAVTVDIGGAAVGGYVNAYSLANAWLGAAGVDPSGSYAINGLPAGEVKLQFSQFTNAFSGWFDGATDFASADTVAVSAGASVTVNSVLEAAASITGTVTGSDGSPSQGGWINVYDVDGGFVPSSGGSFDNGHFTVGGLPAGEVKVQFSRFDNGLDQWFDGATSLEDATVVTLTKGLSTEINVVLEPAGAIEGQITAADGSPAAWGWVEAYDAEGRQAQTTSVDGQGKYRLGGLAGTYYIKANPQPGSAAQWFDGASSRADATPVTVAAGETATANMTLVTPGTIEVTVNLPAANGPDTSLLMVGAYDAAGDPVGQRDYKEPYDGSTFTLTDLPPGDVYISLFSGSGGTYTEQFLGGDNLVPSGTPVSIASGEIKYVAFDVQPIGAISGQVDYANPDAASSAAEPREYLVYAEDSVTGEWRQVPCNECGGMIDPLATGWTNADGSFEFIGLVPGDYKIGFRAGWGNDAYLDPADPGRVTTFYGGSTLETATVVTVEAGATTSNIDGVLPRTDTVEVPGTLEVTLEWPDDHGLATDTVCVGAYTLAKEPVGQIDCQSPLSGDPFTITGLSTGDVNVYLMAMGGAQTHVVQQFLGGSNLRPSGTPIAVTATGAASVVFPVQDVGSITGTVSYADDAAVTNPGDFPEVFAYFQDQVTGEWRQVECMECGGGYDPLSTAFANANGEFTLSHLVPGDYKIGFRAGSLNDSYLDPDDAGAVTAFYGGSTLETATVVTVEAGATASGIDGILPRTDLPAELGWTLEGQILRGDGTPWPGAALLFSYAAGGGEVAVGADGYFSVDLPAGMDVALYLGEDIVTGTLLDLVAAPAPGSTVGWSYREGAPVYELVGDSFSLSAAGNAESLWRRANATGFDSWLWGPQHLPSHQVSFGPGDVELVSVTDFTGDGLDDIAVHRSLAGPDAWRVYSVATGVELKKFFGSGDITSFFVADVTGGEGAEIISDVYRGPGVSVALSIWDVEADGPVQARYTAWGEPDKRWTVDLNGDGKDEILYSQVRESQNDAFWIFDVDKAETRRVNVGPGIIDDVLFADTDGDRYLDIITLRLRPGNSAYWSVWESASETKTTVRLGWGAITPHTFDVDGDGRAEVLASRAMNPSTVRWWYASTFDPDVVTVVDLPMGTLPAT